MRLQLWMQIKTNNLYIYLDTTEAVTSKEIIVGIRIQSNLIRSSSRSIW
jgi:hypothetical protein